MGSSTLRSFAKCQSPVELQECFLLKMKLRNKAKDSLRRQRIQTIKRWTFLGKPGQSYRLLDRKTKIQAHLNKANVCCDLLWRWFGSDSIRLGVVESFLCALCFHIFYLIWWFRCHICPTSDEWKQSELEGWRQGTSSIYFLPVMMIVYWRCWYEFMILHCFLISKTIRSQ